MQLITTQKYENAKGLATAQIFVTDGNDVWVVLDMHEKIGNARRMMIHNGQSANRQFYAKDVMYGLILADIHFNEVFG